jgi:hypothetical protein
MPTGGRMSDRASITPLDVGPSSILWLRLSSTKKACRRISEGGLSLCHLTDGRDRTRTCDVWYVRDAVRRSIRRQEAKSFTVTLGRFQLDEKAARFHFCFDTTSSTHSASVCATCASAPAYMWPAF